MLYLQCQKNSPRHAPNSTPLCTAARVGGELKDLRRHIVDITLWNENLQTSKIIYDNKKCCCCKFIYDCQI